VPAELQSVTKVTGNGEQVSIAQIQWVSSGWSGGPGYTSFYYSVVVEPDLSTFLDATHDFLDTIKNNLPTSCTYTAPTNARIIAEATGDLIDVVPFATPSTNVTGGAGTGFAAPAGMSINWLTLTPGPSRLITGRTFMVPLDINSYQADGTLTTTALGLFQSAASALVVAGGGDMVIWRRPVGGAGGSLAPVAAAKVNDRVSVLRSRRG
jgi:hypothetical protein